jgi:hypothetical protein
MFWDGTPCSLVDWHVLPWRSRQNIPSKLWYLLIKLYDITLQKAVIYIIANKEVQYEEAAYILYTSPTYIQYCLSLLPLLVRNKI